MSKASQELLNSIQDIISQNAQYFLDQKEENGENFPVLKDPLQIDIIERTLERRLYSPESIASEVSEIFGMCIYYEDLINKRKEAVDSQLFETAWNALREKAVHYEKYTTLLKTNSEEITDCETFCEKITKLKADIRKFEDFLKQ